MCTPFCMLASYVCQNDAVCVAFSRDLVPVVPLVYGAGEVVEADCLIRCACMCACVCVCVCV